MTRFGFAYQKIIVSVEKFGRIKISSWGAECKVHHQRLKLLIFMLINAWSFSVLFFSWMYCLLSEIRVINISVTKKVKQKRAAVSCGLLLANYFQLISLISLLSFICLNQSWSIGKVAITFVRLFLFNLFFLKTFDE